MNVLLVDSQSLSEPYLKSGCISSALLGSDSAKLISIFVEDRNHN